MSNNTLVNVIVATTSALQNVKFSSTAIVDICDPPRFNLVIDGVTLSEGNLVLIKDNSPSYNGIYKVSKLSSKGFILTKKVYLERVLSATIYILQGQENGKSLFALVRRSKNKSALNFEKIEQITNMPLKSVVNETDISEVDKSFDTKELLAHQSTESGEEPIQPITEELFKDRLNKLLSTESLMSKSIPNTPREPVQLDEQSELDQKEMLKPPSFSSIFGAINTAANIAGPAISSMMDKGKDKVKEPKEPVHFETVMSDPNRLKSLELQIGEIQKALLKLESDIAIIYDSLDKAKVSFN